MLEIIWMAIFGLFVGLIARLLMPGKDSMGLIMTAVLGIVGSLLGTFLGRALLGRGTYYQARMADVHSGRADPALSLSGPLHKTRGLAARVARTTAVDPYRRLMYFEARTHP